MTTTQPTSRYTKYKHGFSLVEILVVVGIIGLLAVVSIARYRDFDSTILLESLAYDIALATREAQVLGIAVRGQEGGFHHAYGIHFDRNNPREYILFFDIDDEMDFDKDETVTVYTVGKNVMITDLCFDDTCDVNKVDVTFKRPHPDAHFVGDGIDSEKVNTLSVTLASPSGERQVVITRAGQISVE